MGIFMMDSMGWPYDSFDCLLFKNHLKTVAVGDQDVRKGGWEEGRRCHPFNLLGNMQGIHHNRGEDNENIYGEGVKCLNIFEEENRTIMIIMVLMNLRMVVVVRELDVVASLVTHP